MRGTTAEKEETPNCAVEKAGTLLQKIKNPQVHRRKSCDTTAKKEETSNCAVGEAEILLQKIKNLQICRRT